MAKVLFIMKYPLHRPDNLKQKFDGQMEAVKRLGHQAYWLGWDAEGIWLCGGQEKRLVKKSRKSALPGYSHTFLFIDLMAGLMNAVEQEQFDLLYMRFMPTFGNAPGALRAAKTKGARLVVEHPTYPFTNGKTTSLLRRPVFAYTDRVFAKIEPMIDLFTLIGDPNDGELDGRPAMNIVNGVEAEALPLHQPRRDDPEIHMLALASMSHWQGYDRLIRAMAGWEEAVYLHMVGSDGDGSLAAWKQLAQELGLQNRVLFEGEAYGQELDRLTARCDIGIGGLGLYRKAQFCSMTLKLREYMARGLPFVYAVDDPSIPEEKRFCLRIPNDDSLPDMEQIVAFAKSAKEDGEAPALMRDYALRHMSWTAVLKPVLERVGMKCQER